MKAEKDKKTGKWLIQYRYTDWQGKRRKSTKRGFATKREAEEWLRNFLITQKADFDMKFGDFWQMYCADMETCLREHTIRTKKYIVKLKILPYFGNKRVNDITAADIRQWQNELIKMGYSPTYLKTINNQLSAIFNYAVRYYDLKSKPLNNPAYQAIRTIANEVLYSIAISASGLKNRKKQKGKDFEMRIVDNFGRRYKWSKTEITCSLETMELVFQDKVEKRTLYIDEYKNGSKVEYVGP